MYTQLGRAGLKVSRICLGMMTYGSKEWRPWILDEHEAKPMIERALEKGINFFDTADMYSVGESERIVGRAIVDVVPRDRVVIATKVFFSMNDSPNGRGLSRKHIMEAVDASLRRLKTDYIDLYQIHRYDPATPIDETLEALDDVVRVGKVLYLGASSMAAWQFAKMLGRADLRGWRRFVSMQNHYNLAYREEEREMMPLCAEEGVGVLPWSPLARGLLTGSRSATERTTIRAQTDSYADQLYTDPSDFEIGDRVRTVAERRGVPRAAVALAWLLSRPAVVSPVIGATKPEHIDDAVAALELKLSEEETSFLEEPYVPHRVLGH
jgi:1-deoxyxylulose-5-phosphate synthase